MRRAGLTLVEVVVACAILTVGVLALLSLQLHTLALQRRAQTVIAMVRLAEAELERRLAQLGAAAGSCSEPLPESAPGLSCTVSSEACALAAGVLSCGPAGEAQRAVRVTVTLTSSAGGTVELSSLAAPWAAP